jgi:hypothetical protein
LKKKLVHETSGADFRGWRRLNGMLSCYLFCFKHEIKGFPLKYSAGRNLGPVIGLPAPARRT